MLRSYAPSMCLTIWALILVAGVRAEEVVVPVLLSAAASLWLMTIEFRKQIKGERRSGHDRRRHV